MTCFFTSSAVIVLCLFLLFSSCQAAKYQRTVRYDDEILIRCPPGMKEFLESDAVDIWQVTADGMVDVRIHKDLLKETTTTATAAKRECVTLANVETLVQQFENITIQHKPGQDEWFEEYHNYDEGVGFYEGLCRTGKCRFEETIGRSLEERKQPAIHIGTGDKQIYLQCLIHAREWISGAFCMYFTDYLVKSEEERVTSLLEKVEFVIVPYVNPDGYAYSWTGNRLWRKNRRINSGSSCIGVDLNRNYNDHWNEGGSSSNPCSETYHGTGPASEPETQNTQNYFKANAPVIGAIDWHSYGQLILRPYGWTNVDAPDEERMKAVNDEMSNIILSVHGKRYTSQKSIGLYPTTGSADDWFYGEDATDSNEGYRAPGLTIELRDTGAYGFLLPPEEIIPVGEEVTPAVLYFAEQYSEMPLYKN